MHIEAVYEHGVLRPVVPLSLPEGKRVGVTLTALVEVESSRAAKAERDTKEIEVINRNCKALNEEALDVLSYQVVL